MSESRTDVEVICEFMEPRPIDGSGPVVTTPESRWWVYTYSVIDKMFHWRWHANGLDLDALREVEERLSEDQWQAYFMAWPAGFLGFRPYVHASAELKIKALAAVLREVA